MTNGFTVIEGGGGSPPPLQRAKELFRRFLVHLLRSVGGGGSDTDIIISLREFLVYCAEHDAHWGSAMCEVVDNVRRDIFIDYQSRHDESAEIERIELSETCIRFIAEHIAEDQAAPARRSRHRAAMWAQIEEIVRTHEIKARQHDWSYLQEMLDEFPKLKG